MKARLRGGIGRQNPAINNAVRPRRGVNGQYFILKDVMLD
jgi:hypothetical protein